MNAASQAPAGWGFNPSNARHRIRAWACGAGGLALSVVCLLHAHGIVDPLWEPWPVVDANGWILPAARAPWPELDVIGFATMLVLAALGGDDRWRARPRTVIAMGVAAALTVAFSLLGWALQFAVVGTTSTLFFASVAAAVGTLALIEDEVYAAVVHLRRSRLDPASDNLPYDSVTGGRLGISSPPSADYAAGASAMLLGVALLVVSNGVSMRAAAHERLLGGVVVAVGALSLAQVARPLRWINAAIGAWLLVAPLAHGYALRGTIHSVVFGLLLLAVSTVGAPLAERRQRRAPRA